MNNKHILFLGIFLGLGSLVHAQNLDDVTRYSRTMYQGTARSTAAGNAFGAVGSDYGGLNINPAGLGLYRQSEFTFTLGYSQAGTHATYLGSSASDRDYNLNVGNLGLVSAKPRIRDGKEVTDGWVSVNWAFGFNRTNNFNSNTTITGNNTKNSILNMFKEDANYQAAHNGVTGPNQLNFGSYGDLGYQAYLINPYRNDAGDTTYQDATKFDGNINNKQTTTIQTSGSTSTINLTIGGNYSNKLYLGGSIGFPVINYTNITTFTEENLNPAIAANDSQYHKAILTEQFNTSGIGITANFGAIYRFSDLFRIGISGQLPSFYSLSDQNWNRTVEGFVGQADHKQTTNDNGIPFNYNMVTPAIVTASGAFIFGKHGFVSADYEYVDYSTAQVSSDNSDQFTTLNQSIRKSLVGVNSVRVGGEFTVDQFAVRAGYNYISSPYKSNLANTGFGDAYNIYSLGVGFRDNNVSLDLTYQYIHNNSTYNPYYLEDGTAPSANVSTTRSNVLLTLVARFDGGGNNATGNRRHRYYR